MRGRHVERTTLVSLFVILIGLSIWMQFGLLTQDANTTPDYVRHEPDYFIRNFIATGRNETSARYVLTGTYLEHFPDNYNVEIKQPCLLLFEKDTPYRQVYGDTGKISSNGNEIVFIGNVQVLEQPADVYDWNSIITASSNYCFPDNMTDSGTLTRTDELVVQLKPLRKI